MKHLKIKPLFFLSLIFLLGCNSQKNVKYLRNYNWFSFEWHSAEISGKKYDKVAMLVPAKVNDTDANFVMQFDLGSDATMLYGKTLKNYFSNDELDSFLKKESKFTSNSGEISYVTQNLSLYFGSFKFDSSIYAENYGEEVPKDSLYSKDQKLLGTIGADAFKNKILIIDYPNKKMCALDDTDEYLEKNTQFVEAQIQKGRIHIPIKIGEKVYWFLFDTGASLFPISTSKDVWKKLVGNTNPTDTIVSNSWGEKVNCYGAPIKEKAYLGSNLLKSSLAYYTENEILNDFNTTEKIDGLTGNAFFTSNIIVIDFKNNRFGILK